MRRKSRHVEPECSEDTHHAAVVALIDAGAFERHNLAVPPNVPELESCDECGAVPVMTFYRWVAYGKTA